MAGLKHLEVTLDLGNQADIKTIPEEHSEDNTDHCQQKDGTNDVSGHVQGFIDGHIVGLEGSGLLQRSLERSLMVWSLEVGPVMSSVVMVSSIVLTPVVSSIFLAPVVSSVEMIEFLREDWVNDNNWLIYLFEDFVIDNNWFLFFWDDNIHGLILSCKWSFDIGWFVGSSIQVFWVVWLSVVNNNNFLLLRDWWLLIDNFKEVRVVIVESIIHHEFFSFL